MPELPEVQTTVHGLDTHVRNYVINDVWTDYNSKFHAGKDSIKNPKFFTYFKEEVVGSTISHVSRRAKNILIHLEKSNKPHGTILIHMKMTGHILYGKYDFNSKKKRDPWTPTEEGPLKDPFNRFIHFVMTLSNKHQIALSDMRKFAKVTFIPHHKHSETIHLSDIGPEPLEDAFTFTIFKERIMRKPNGRIKPTIMDQSVMAGVGNIYADESLWRAEINPEQKVETISLPRLKKLYEAIRGTLAQGIDFGGDSMSDYRNIHGERGKFQETHRAYRKTGTLCSKKGCKGTIVRKVIAGRSGHFCNIHQKLTTN